MDRNREGRRGNMAAVNGLSRRRPRTGSLRDSPEEDGVAEMQESTRLRDRGSKKDRDRDRSSRSKRRRGDRMLHGSNREEGEDSTDESMEEEDDEDEEDPGAAVRLPPPPPPPSNPSPQSSTLPTNPNPRKSLPTKVIRSPPVWKAADEMIGVSVPRKARSACAKRSQECGLSGGGGGGGEQMHRQASTSPSRPSQAAAAPASISPSSSNVSSVRKKTKQISGTKQRPPKMSKSASIQEIEIEVAEVLYGLTRRFQVPSKQEAQTPDVKDTSGTCNETKSRASSPNSISPPPAISPAPVLPPHSFSTAVAPLPAVAPKRKRPRPVKFEDESPTSPPNHSVLPSVSVSSTSEAPENEQPKMDVPSPRSEKMIASSPAENGDASLDMGSHQGGEKPADVREESMKSETVAASDVKPPVPELDGQDRGEIKEEPSAPPAKEPAPVELDVNDAAVAAVKTAADGSREKFKIDLMAPPPGKSSPERESDFAVDDKSPVQDIDMGQKVDSLKVEDDRYDRAMKLEARDVWREEKGEKSSAEGLDSEKSIKKETSLGLQLEIEKHDRDGISVSKQQGSRQQSKVSRTESKPDKAAQVGSLPLPVSVGGWPGGLPFGYMGQVPSLQAVVPMDGSTVASKALHPPHFLSQPLRPKRCATHCYIAQNIYYHQQLARMNPFWSAAAGSTPLYGAKPYNLNVMPSADSAILSNSLQGGFSGRGLGSLQDKVAPGVGSFPVHSSKEKGSSANFIDSAQRKPLVLQQPLQAGSTNNMLPAPAFIFPINQPQAAVAATACSRTAPVKPNNMNVASSNGSASAVVSSGSAAASTAGVSFNYANLPHGEAQYVVLQNHGYPFPIPAHVGAPPYRAGNHTQAMPFFSGSLYASQLLHSSQLQPQLQPQQAPSAQQGPQKASTSTGSSSSQKHPQPPQKTPGGSASGTGGLVHVPASKQRQQHLPPHQPRQLECEAGSEDSPSTADSRISQSQKGLYGHGFVMPLNHQSFALMPTAAALTSGANHNEKLHQHPPSQQQQQQNMKVELAPSQAFAMSFASFNGPAASGHHGLDFSATPQNHTIFQSLPEMARHGYQLAAPAAAQHKKAQHQIPEGGKFLGEPMNVSLPSEEERKAIVAGKASSNISQHSLTFSRADGDPSTSAVVGNSVIDSSTRTLNLIPAAVNGGQVPNRPVSAAPASATASSASGGATSSQHQHQQQHSIHLQKQRQQLQQQQLQQQQQQQLQMQQQLSSRAKPTGSSNNVGVYSDRFPAGTAMPKFPNALAGFPQALIQASNPSQSQQWKSSARTSTSMPSPAPNPTPPVKNHLPQHQGRTPQPTHSNVGHHSQISFGMNSTKPSPSGQQHHLTGASSVQTSVSAAATSVGSPPTSVSKSAGSSPRASNGSKTGPASTTLPPQQPTLSKNSVTGPSHKSSPVSNRNVPSILGQQPHMAASPSSVTKSQQQHQQLQPQQQGPQQQNQLQKQQAFPSQIFFTNPYLPVQSHSNAAAAAAPGYHQRRASEQQQPPPPQPNSPSVSTGMLSLCASASTLASTGAATSDPAKAVAAAAAAAAAANGVKGLPSPSLLQAAQFAAAAHSASGSSHALMSAAGFPYFHAMSSVSVNPAEQKPAAGNDTLHACWQPEKR